jgi:hypothetical protein
MWIRMAVPLTLLSYGGLRDLGLPLVYAPLGAVPAILLYLMLKLLAWRDRRAGRRFHQYDACDFPG